MRDHIEWRAVGGPDVRQRAEGVRHVSAGNLTEINDSLDACRALLDRHHLQRTTSCSPSQTHPTISQIAEKRSRIYLDYFADLTQRQTESLHRSAVNGSLPEAAPASFVAVREQLGVTHDLCQPSNCRPLWGVRCAEGFRFAVG